MSDAIAIVVDEDRDAGERTDVVLGRRVPGLSRRAARALALAGRVRCNDIRVPPSHRVQLGDRLALAGTPHIEPPAVRVLAVTDAFVYADKPAEMHTHRLRPDDPPALADAIAVLHPECAGSSDDPREGGAVHRLDRGTTGVVAFARSRAAWQAGRTAIGEPSSVKLYVALCEIDRPPAWPPRATPELQPCAPPPWPRDLPRPRAESPLRLALPLGRGSSRDRVTVRADGRPCATILAPLAFAALPDAPRDRLLVALQLLGGHRHQARVHLAWLGMPIEGDDRYGHSGAVFALHCSALDLSASCPGEQRVDAPIGAVLRARLDTLPLRPWAPPIAPW